MFSPHRIDIDNAAEFMLWADNLSITQQQLYEIVDRVGPMVAAVQFYLKKSAIEAARASGGSAKNRAPRARADRASPVAVAGARAAERAAQAHRQAHATRPAEASPAPRQNASAGPTTPPTVLPSMTT